MFSIIQECSNVFLFSVTGNYSANPSMASTTLDSLPTDIGLSSMSSSTCLMTQKSLDNMTMMSMNSSGMSFGNLLGSNASSTSASSFHSIENVGQTAGQAQVANPVFKTETMDVSTAIPSTTSSSIHAIPVSDLTFESFYPTSNAAPTTQDSFQSSYGSSTSTVGSMTANNQLPVYEQHVSQANNIQLQSNMQANLQSNLQTNLQTNSIQQEYQHQSVSAQETCTFSSQEVVPPTTVAPIDLSSFQTEVRRQDSGLADQTSGSFCGNVSQSSATTTVDCNPVSVAGLPTPQAIQSINVMTQMTDNELLGFINPSTFD